MNLRNAQKQWVFAQPVTYDTVATVQSIAELWNFREIRCTDGFVAVIKDETWDN